MLLGLFSPAAPQEDAARAWDYDVLLREVRDVDGTLLGRVYLDLYPREGKFSHAAAFDLVRSRQDADGRRIPALAALVTNFSPPRGDRPGLLRHDEMVTLFHELGDGVHETVTLKFVTCAALLAPRPCYFVEAPSQLMERWAWEPAVVERAARHWSTGRSRCRRRSCRGSRRHGSSGPWAGLPRERSC